MSRRPWPGCSPWGGWRARPRCISRLGLPLHNPDALSALLQQLYDPASPNYRHYLTPGQFTERFGPTEQECQAVADFARARGLTVNAVHPNRLVLR